MTTRLPQLWLLVLCGAATVAVGCESAAPEVVVPPPDHPSPPLAKGDGSLCGGILRGTCVQSCGLSATDTEPRCVAGRWSCTTGVPDSICPEFQGVCDPSALCGHGYTCVQSISYPAPADAGICRKLAITRDLEVESCSHVGALTPLEFIRSRVALTGQIVKIAAQMKVHYQCTKNACSPNTPCCNTCVGNYFVDVAVPSAPDLGTTRITVGMDHVPCYGTTCEKGCAPFLEGDTYLLWGLLDSCQGANCKLLLMGSCLF